MGKTYEALKRAEAERAAKATRNADPSTEDDGSAGESSRLRGRGGATDTGRA